MIKRTWYIINAENKVLGRLSSIIVRYLTGKHKTEYVPYADIGDYVIVINSKKIYISGRKQENKVYYRHTGYVGGIKKTTFKQMISCFPNKIIEISVKGMLPKNSLGRIMYRRLRVYSGNVHNHIAQSPIFLNNSWIK